MSKTRRIPVPQKPPKVEDDKRSYDRKKEKRKTRKDIEELKKERKLAR